MSESLSGGTVSIPIKPNAEGFSAELSHIFLGQSGTFAGLGKDLGKKLLGGFALAEIGLKIGETIGNSIKIAAGDQQQVALLQTAVKNAGFDYEKLAPKIDAAEVSGRKFGFTNKDTIDALSQLTVGLQDPAKALDVMSVAQDLAIAKHMDLSAAALLVTKGMEGQIRPLKALGIDIPVFTGNAQAVALAQDKVAKAQQKVNDILAKSPDAIDPASKAHDRYTKAVSGLTAAQGLLAEKQASGDQILAAISDRLKGSAAAAADTFAGKQAALSSNWDDLQGKIGKLLTGPLTKVVDWMNGDGFTAVSLFAQGWDGVGTSLSNTAAAGKITHDVLKNLFDFIGQAGTGLGEIMAWAVTPIGQNEAAKAAQDAAFAKNIGDLHAANTYNRVVNGRDTPKNAVGGTYQPRVGGHVIQVAEAGRSETVVDTESLNRAVAQRSSGNINYHIYEAVSADATALQVSRRQALNGA
jgi:hypothetical protein